MIFNLIPIPPLDGGAVLAWLLPRSMHNVVDFLARYGGIILMLLVLSPSLGLPLMSVIGYPIRLITIVLDHRPQHGGGTVKRRSPHGRRRTHRASATQIEAAGHPAYRVTLPEFEGPLDLLLHLCQTHELDILNISIAFIAEKYIEYLELMQNMSVEVAADYLVMAAHLAYLKSRELVPSPEPLEASEDGEEPIDPREELIRACSSTRSTSTPPRTWATGPSRGATCSCAARSIEGGGRGGPGRALGVEAARALGRRIAGRGQAPVHTHDVVVDRMSITDRINQLVDLLEAEPGHGPLRGSSRQGPARGRVAPQGRGVAARGAGAGPPARHPHPAAGIDGRVLPGQGRRRRASGRA